MYPRERSRLAPLAELRRELSRIVGFAARAVAHHRLPGEPERPRRGLERGRESLARPRPVGDQADAALRQLEVPRIERGSRAGAGSDPAEEGVALRERARVATACVRPRRPQRRSKGVEMVTASARRPLDQRQAIRHEDRQAGTAGGALRRRRRAVDEMATSVRAADREQERPSTPVVGDHRLRPGERLAEGDRLALVPGPTRAARKRHIGRLEEVRLPGPVWSPEQIQARPQRELGGGQIAQVEHADCVDNHRGG